MILIQKAPPEGGENDKELKSPFSGLPHMDAANKQKFFITWTSYTVSKKRIHSNQRQASCRNFDELAQRSSLSPQHNIHTYQ